MQRRKSAKPCHSQPCSPMPWATHAFGHTLSRHGPWRAHTPEHPAMLSISQMHMHGPHRRASARSRALGQTLCNGRRPYTRARRACIGPHTLHRTYLATCLTTRPTTLLTLCVTTCSNHMHNDTSNRRPLLSAAGQASDLRNAALAPIRRRANTTTDLTTGTAVFSIAAVRNPALLNSRTINVRGAKEWGRPSAAAAARLFHNESNEYDKTRQDTMEHIIEPWVLNMATSLLSECAVRQSLNVILKALLMYKNIKRSSHWPSRRPPAMSRRTTSFARRLGCQGWSPMPLSRSRTHPRVTVQQSHQPARSLLVFGY